MTTVKMVESLFLKIQQCFQRLLSPHTGLCQPKPHQQAWTVSSTPSCFWLQPDAELCPSKATVLQVSLALTSRVALCHQPSPCPPWSVLTWNAETHTQFAQQPPKDNTGQHWCFAFSKTPEASEAKERAGAKCHLTCRRTPTSPGFEFSGFF